MCNSRRRLSRYWRATCSFHFIIWLSNCCAREWRENEVVLVSLIAYNFPGRIKIEYRTSRQRGLKRIIGSRRGEICVEKPAEGIVALTNWLFDRLLRVRSFRRVRRFSWPGLTLTTSIRVESSTWRGGGRGGLSAGTVLTGHWTHRTHGTPEPDLTQPNDARSPPRTQTMQSSRSLISAVKEDHVRSQNEVQPNMS